MRIFIGGDFAPTEYNEQLFKDGDGDSLYSKEMLDYLKEFDFRIFDFETVFEGQGAKINKAGPYMTTSVDTLPGIKSLDPNLMILANNHTGNLGVDGVEHTCKVFNDNGIDTIGAGRTLADARKAYIYENDGIKVGFLAFAEHEFTYADDSRGGVNPFDYFNSYDDIAELKQSCDYVICFYHGGLIEYRYPTPLQQRRLRRMVDCGADLVVSQHTHCIGCEEHYKGKTILYGQGDFLFARPTRNEYRYSGLLLDVNVTKDGISVQYKVRVKPKDTIRFADVNEEREIIDAFAQREQDLINGLIVSKFEEFTQKNYKRYMSCVIGKDQSGLIYRAINKLMRHQYVYKLFKKKYNKRAGLSLWNYIECESHNEVLRRMMKLEYEKME